MYAMWFMLPCCKSSKPLKETYHGAQGVRLSVTGTRCSFWSCQGKLFKNISQVL